ncbi:MAG: hypothetical protein K2M16_08485, partial [Muribaculaceae bacterium]|nr:hypothetical protein [Muribaculaceae bacterium]
WLIQRAARRIRLRGPLFFCPPPPLTIARLRLTSTRLPYDRILTVSGRLNGITPRGVPHRIIIDNYHLLRRASSIARAAATEDETRTYTQEGRGRNGHEPSSFF